MRMEFIGLAEKTGLIHQFRAVGVAAGTGRLGATAQLLPSGGGAAGLHLAINLSAPELSAPAIVAQVRGLLNRYDIPPAN